ncbi:MAG: Enolase [Alphaproteobacteria bacterium MarineAlpha8_Bin1]|nr:MAG: Enolase [Alphaproteobacteria bacterium MarineAlpha8_Bin1]|tara:strand:+ start:172 stop:1449 length:1278 start_codon:yes stop_codon:yes gene_type:complete
MPKIKNIFAREIIDSRGVPTVECEMELDSEIFARASVPSGASTGSFESHELRDNDKSRFFSKGVSQAVNSINVEIKQTILGYDASDQKNIDQTLIELDGTKNKSRLGANSILAVSLACARASANFFKIPLYRYLGGVSNVLPTPMMNIINGGCHSNNKLNFQEFMIIPMGFDSFKESLRAGCEIFHNLKNILLKKNYSISVGDEGGFSPEISSNRECLDLILKSIDLSSYKIGNEIFIGLDVAASEFFSDNKYNLSSESLNLNSESLIKYYEDLVRNYPIISIEDGLDENDWNGWKELTSALGGKCQLVGDDLFVTSTDKLKKGIKENCGNSILIKLNQIGTLSETLEAINLAKSNKFNTIISHRSGETEDTFISDLSVGIASGQIKTGSLSRTERIAKYNQLLRIEDNDNDISFSSKDPFKKFL